MKISIKDNMIISADKNGLDFIEKILNMDEECFLQLNDIFTKYKVNNTVSCKECGTNFFSTNFNATYCEKCKQQMGKIRYKNRKDNGVRFIHKEILDILYNIKTDKKRIEDFRKESNYYWGILNGEIAGPNTNYTELMLDEYDYLVWLRKKRDEVKLLKKIL